MSDKRKYQRYPVIHEIDKPIALSIEGNNVLSVLVDLSCGGLALLSYANVPIGTAISMAIKLPGIETKELQGSVVWAIQKGDMWRIGITFTKIEPSDFRSINKMAFEYNDCETKLSLGVRDVCSAKCTYMPMCQKPVKIPYRYGA